MALSMTLAEHELGADRIATIATVKLEKVDGGFAITAIHLDLEADIPGASEDTFKAAAEAAKSGCPVSKLMTAEITLSTIMNG